MTFLSIFTQAIVLLVAEACSPKPKMYSTEQRGSLYSDTFKLYFKDNAGNFISPMHDIPIRPHADKPNIFSMVVEIPRWTNAKMEINKEERLNAIKQDRKNGKLRYVAHVFPNKGYIWNYGAIPQTWEDPRHTDPDTKAKGDGDPIDIVDVGSKIHRMGSVINVKILGILALVDEGETDWKLISIDVNDPLADAITDLETLENHKPGLLTATVEWFRNYKIPDGKPANSFAFGGKVREADFALKIINETHDLWKALMASENGYEEISRDSTTSRDSKIKVSPTDAAAIVASQAPLSNDAQPGEEVDVWHYIKK